MSYQKESGCHWGKPQSRTRRKKVPGFSRPSEEESMPQKRNGVIKRFPVLAERKKKWWSETPETGGDTPFGGKKGIVYKKKKWMRKRDESPIRGRTISNALRTRRGGEELANRRTANRAPARISWGAKKGRRKKPPLTRRCRRERCLARQGSRYCRGKGKKTKLEKTQKTILPMNGGERRSFDSKE